MRSARFTTLLALLAGVSQAAWAAGAAGSPVSESRVAPATVLQLAIHGAGELRFGEAFQWKLVTGLPAGLSGDGTRIGDVVLQSESGAVRYRLPEPPAYGLPENGPSCTVLRTGPYAIIRCGRDYLFNTVTGKQPVLIWPQFSNRINPEPRWLAGMALPWWRPSGSAIRDVEDNQPELLFLEYGWVNYGQAVESTEIGQGPALLDLKTGRIARARVGATADGSVYDASLTAGTGAVAVHPADVIRDDHKNGRRVITVLTVFDRCVAAMCRGDHDPTFRREKPLTYVFGQPAAND